MLNPNAVLLATLISTLVPDMLIEVEGNVLTLEETGGERFLVTVQSMFTATSSLPGSEDVIPSE